MNDILKSRVEEVNKYAAQLTPAPAPRAPDDYRFRQAFEAFRQVHEFRKDTDFMDRFHRWVREQAKDMARLIDTIEAG